MKLKVGVFFGGRSVEHEISIISASQAIKALDENKYEVIPVYIDKKGEFYTGDVLLDIKNFHNLKEVCDKAIKINIVRQNQHVILEPVKKKLFNNKPVNTIDVAFPVIHGTNGEDGTLQGFLEMLQIPYVGCDVKGAVTGQDKIFMKNILRDNNIKVVEFNWFYDQDYFNDQEKIINKVEAELTYPVIVKPATLGSSIGISKAKDRQGLIDAIETAIQYDNRILVEEMIANLVEVNCSVLGDYSGCKASAIEEVFQNDEILSFNDKYTGSSASKGSKSGGSKGMASTKRIIPARIGEELLEEVATMAKKGFQALGASGVCRIDFLINSQTKEVYINEINTIPGSLSFYLWSEVGVEFDALCDELIRLAIKRQAMYDKRIVSYDSNVLASFASSGSKGSKGGSKN